MTAQVVLPLARLWLTCPQEDRCLVCDITYFSSEEASFLLGTPGLAIRGKLFSTEVDYQFGFICAACHVLTPQPYRVCGNPVDLDREISPFLISVNEALLVENTKVVKQQKENTSSSSPGDANDQHLLRIGSNELHVNQGRCAFCNRRNTKLENKTWQQGTLETLLPSCPSHTCQSSQRQLKKHKWWIELNLLNAAFLVKRLIPTDVFLHQLDRSGEITSLPFCWACGQSCETELRCAGCAGAGYCSTVCWLSQQDEPTCPHDCQASLWAEPLLMCSDPLPTFSFQVS